MLVLRVMKLCCTWNDEAMFVFSNEVVFVFAGRHVHAPVD